MTNPVFLLLVTALSIAVVWKGSTTLERTSENLALYYRLPPIVEGAIIAAIGSSFPELSSTVISALLHGEFELGVSVIAGSAIFNILVIPGISGLVSRNPLSSNRDLVFKEAQFYLISALTVLITFALAVIYNPADPAEMAGSAAAAGGGGNAGGASAGGSTDSGGRYFGTIGRPLMLIPVLLYVLYVFLQYSDSRDHEGEAPPEHIRPIKEWMLLGLSLLGILAGIEGLVRAAIGFGTIFQTPSALWGVTVIAVATSVSDTFISVKAARNGKAVVSLSNVLGSNVFDLLIAIPAGVLIAGSAVISFSLAAPLFVYLIVSAVVLLIFIRTDMSLSRIESVSLLLLYGLFVVWMVLETFDLIDLIPI